VLRQTPFRLLWTNLVVFALVTNAMRFTFIVVVVRVLDRSESAAGLVGFTIGLPVVFLVLQAGALADRVDRKVLLVASQLGVLAVTLATGVLLAADRVGMGSVVVLTLLAGTCHALGQPVRLALVPAVVTRDRLLDAVAFNAVGMTMSMILGPVMAELATEWWGVEGAFFLMAALMAAALVAAARLDVPAVAVQPRASMWREIRAGVAHVVKDRPVRMLFVMLTVGNVINAAMVMTMLPSFVAEEFGHDAEDAGTLLSCMGIGLLLSSVLVMRLGSLRRKGAIFLRAFMVGSTCLVILGLVPGFGAAAAVVGVMGLAGGFYTNMNQSLVQSRTPDELMGRVMSLYSFGQQGLMPIGALAAGVVASVVGLRATFVGGGIVSLSLVVAAYLTQHQLRELA
jgi:MFS family permease